MDLSEDDLKLGLVTYDCRINRKKMPYNGHLRLLSDYISFYSENFVGCMNLVMPYSFIINIKSSKNM
jgi:hypothetical protein